MAELRLFTAVRPPDKAVDAIARTATSMEAAIGSRAVRWVSPGNYHVTLEFLGATDEVLVNPIAEAMRSVAREATAALTLATGPVGAFPNARRPRTLWVDVTDPDGSLAAIEAALRRRLKQLDVAVDPKPFRPHITIGYVRRHARSAELASIAAAVRGAESEHTSFVVRTLHLVSSTTAPGGSLYDDVVSLPLGGE